MAGNHLFFFIAEVLDGEVLVGVSLGDKPCQWLGHLCIDNIMTFAIGEGKDIEILHETEFADAIGEVFFVVFADVHTKRGILYVAECLNTIDGREMMVAGMFLSANPFNGGREGGDHGRWQAG